MKKMIIFILLVNSISLFSIERITRTEFELSEFKGNFDIIEKKNEKFEKLVLEYNMNTKLYKFVIGYYYESKFTILNEFNTYEQSFVKFNDKVAESTAEMGFYSVNYSIVYNGDSSYKLIVTENRAVLNPNSDFPDPTGEIVLTQREYIFNK